LLYIAAQPAGRNTMSLKIGGGCRRRVGFYVIGAAPPFLYEETWLLVSKLEVWLVLNEITLSEIESEIQDAKKRLELAYQNFNNAAGGFVDVAIYELSAAILRYNLLLKEYRRAACIESSAGRA